MITRNLIEQNGFPFGPSGAVIFRGLGCSGTRAPQDYNAYRGDLATLRQTGIYTQDSASVGGASHFCDIAGSLGDADLPDPGQAFFCLPVAWGAIEGGLGFDQRPIERPKHLTCQGA